MSPHEKTLSLSLGRSGHEARWRHFHQNQVRDGRRGKAVDRHFADVKDLEYEVGNARIWGGIHYRSSVVDGTEIGKRTANQVLAHHFHQSKS